MKKNFFWKSTIIFSRFSLTLFPLITVVACSSPKKKAFKKLKHYQWNKDVSAYKNIYKLKDGNYTADKNKAFGFVKKVPAWKALNPRLSWWNSGDTFWVDGHAITKDSIWVYQPLDTYLYLSKKTLYVCKNTANEYTTKEAEGNGHRINFQDLKPENQPQIKVNGNTYNAKKIFAWTYPDLQPNEKFSYSEREAIYYMANEKLDSNKYTYDKTKGYGYVEGKDVETFHLPEITKVGQSITIDNNTLTSILV